MDIFEKYTPELKWLAQPILLKENNVYEIYLNTKNKIVWWIWIQWILQAILEKNKIISPIKVKPVKHTPYTWKSIKSKRIKELENELNPKKSKNFFKAKITKEETTKK